MKKISLTSFLSLIYHEFFLLKKDFFSQIIDVTVLSIANLLVFGYFMPAIGAPDNYGGFIIVGLMVLLGFFAVITNVVMLVTDMVGDRFISYKLMLPLPSFFVFSSIALGWGLVSMCINIFLLPLGKLILLKELDLSHMSVIKFILIYLSSYIFFGYFALWLAGLIKSVKRVSMIWLRVATPLFMLGSYFTTWQVCYQTSPIIGSLLLFNPLIFITEGTRAAVLGPKGLLPYWTCFFVIWGFILFFAWHSNRILKKRLDCI